MGNNPIVFNLYYNTRIRNLATSNDFGWDVIHWSQRILCEKNKTRRFYSPKNNIIHISQCKVYRKNKLWTHITYFFIKLISSVPLQTVMMQTHEIGHRCECGNACLSLSRVYLTPPPMKAGEGSVPLLLFWVKTIQYNKNKYRNCEKV